MWAVQLSHIAKWPFPLPRHVFAILHTQVNSFHLIFSSRLPLYHLHSHLSLISPFLLTASLLTIDMSTLSLSSIPVLLFFMTKLLEQAIYNRQSYFLYSHYLSFVWSDFGSHHSAEITRCFLPPMGRGERLETSRCIDFYSCIDENLN